MTYVWLNLRSMFKNHRDIFLLIIISEILTALCILFSYGLIMKMQDDNNENERLKYYYRYDIQGQTGLKEKFRQFFSAMNGELSDVCADLSVTDKYGEEHPAMAGKNFVSKEHDLDTGWCDLNGYFKDLADGDTVIICGEKFKIRNIRPDGSFRSVKTPGDRPANSMADDFLIPFDSIPDEAYAYEFNFTVKSIPTQENVERTNEIIRNVFGVSPMFSPEPLDLMKNQESNTFYVYAIVIVIIVVINLSMYFRYIVEQRKKQIKIFTVCGATFRDINSIFLIENLIELALGYATAFAVFHFGLLGVLKRFYKNFGMYYNMRMYIMTSVIFVAGSTLILKLLISPHIRKAASAGEESE